MRICVQLELLSPFVVVVLSLEPVLHRTSHCIFSLQNPLGYLELAASLIPLTSSIRVGSGAVGSAIHGTSAPLLLFTKE